MQLPKNWTVSLYPSYRLYSKQSCTNTLSLIHRRVLMTINCIKVNPTVPQKAWLFKVSDWRQWRSRSDLILDAFAGLQWERAYTNFWSACKRISWLMVCCQIVGLATKVSKIHYPDQLQALQLFKISNSISNEKITTTTRFAAIIHSILGGDDIQEQNCHWRPPSGLCSTCMLPASPLATIQS